MISERFLAWSRYVFLPINLTLGVALACAADEAFERAPIELQAADILPKSLLSGDGYTIEQRVSNDGFQNTYQLETEYGPVQANGTGELLARIREIEAARALDKLEDSEEFKQAVKAGAVGLVEGGKALVTSPVETTKNAARGVGVWLRNAGSSLVSDDPNQDNALQMAVGYDAAKRKYAIAMGVDPYSDFDPLQERLREVAKVATAGSMATSFAADLGAAGDLAGVVLDASSFARMQGVLKDTPPVGLARMNLQKLMDMGIKEYQAEALLKNYNYTPAEMTIICEALQRMGDVRGREIFVAFATSAPDREVARFIRDYAEIMADYLTLVEPGNIVDISGSAWIFSESGSLVGAFPIDYLLWTQSVSGSLANAANKMAERDVVKQKKLLLLGTASPKAQAELQDSGWQLTQNLKFARPK